MSTPPLISSAIFVVLLSPPTGGIIATGLLCTTTLVLDFEFPDPLNKATSGISAVAILTPSRTLNPPPLELSVLLDGYEYRDDEDEVRGDDEVVDDRLTSTGIDVDVLVDAGVSTGYSFVVTGCETGSV